MRVLLINSLYAPHESGGAERSVRILARGLRSRGVKVAVAATARTNDEGEIDGIPVYYARTSSLYWVGDAAQQPWHRKVRWHLRDATNKSVAPWLRGIVEKENPDVVHTHNLSGWSTYAWSVARSERRRIVHTIRDHYLLCTKSTMFRDGSNCRTPCTVCTWHGRRKARGVLPLDAVTAVSDYILQRHRKHGRLPPAQTYRCIPNGVELPAAPKAGEQPTRMFTFGFVGAVAPHKGVELLLRVFAQCQMPNAQLLIFGRASSPEYETRLRRKYETSATVFCGQQEAQSAFPQMDVLVVPSLCHEALGRVVLEAYAHGVPVIAAQRGGLPEIVQSDVTGYLFHPELDTELESRMKAAVASPDRLASMREACRVQARQFSSDLVSNSFLALYEEVVR